MKNQFLLGLMFLATITAIGQKNELKAVAKALKSENLTAAKSSIAQAEPLITNADDKLKAKFYFLKAKTYAEIAQKKPSLDKDAHDISAKSFNELFDFETKIGKSTYTKDATPLFNALIANLRSFAAKQYNSKDYIESAKNFHKVYHMSPKDTFMLDNAASAAHLGKDFKLALSYYIKLNDLGYSGVTTEYKAKNIETGKYESFGSKSARDLMLKTSNYADPKDEIAKSRSISIARNIATIYGKLGDNEKGLEVIKKARLSAPDDYNLLLTEADLQIKLGNRVKFAELMSEAVEKNPDNPILYFNLGVISSEQNKDEEAKKYYAKALELKTDYFDAYLNLASVYLKKEAVINDEMNKLGISEEDDIKYENYKKDKILLYKQILPYYEKAYQIKNDDISLIRSLMSIYESIGKDAEFKNIKAIYDTLKDK